MSQKIWASINPLTTSGVMLAGILDDFKDALMTGFAGDARPTNLQAGGLWVDTLKQGTPDFYWAFKFFDGTNDIEIFRISITNGFGGTLTADSSFEIRHYAADSVGAILEMIKQRINNNGQVLSGDVVAELKFTGRTLTSTDPTVAYIQWASTDNMTTSVSGGTMSFYSTQDASSAIVEHLRFINGIVETVTNHKLNSLRLVSQDVATATTIAQLNSDKVMVEMTGATDTSIQGVNSAGKSGVIYIHNRSTANVTLKHQDASATAADRMKLPRDTDHIISPEGTAQLFYCATDSRWKLRSSGSPVSLTRTVTELRGLLNTWTCPAGVNRIRVTSYRGRYHPFNYSSFIDQFGNMYVWGFAIGADGTLTNKSSPVLVLGGQVWQPIGRETFPNGNNTYGINTRGEVYCWGFNSYGNLGNGNVATQSSPVAVLGGLRFAAFLPGGTTNAALTENGKAYTWGKNDAGELGDGSIVPKSSPVAVLGGLTFAKIILPSFGPSAASMFGLTKDGTAYAWGYNAVGTLGVGDRTNRSSPVAVLGGLSFKKIECHFDVTAPSGTGFQTAVGLTTTGTAYAWGRNNQGQCGVGDTTDRSSPVAVLGGLTFVDIYSGYAGGGSTYGLTSDGTLYAWGVNVDGQLGVGDTVARSSPVAVLGGLKWAAVYPGAGNICGLTKDGDMYCWGSNSFGQCGVGDTVSRSSPVAVVGGLKFTGAVNIDSSSIHAAATNGATYSWGDNQGSGALGDGTPSTNRSSPTIMAGPNGIRPVTAMQETVIDVSPGSSYTVLLAQTMSRFGNTPIGINIDSITIEYDK